MQRLFRKTVIKSLMTSLLFMNSWAYASNYKKLDELVELLDKEDKAMLAIAVRKEGKLIYETYTGLSSISDKKVVDKNSTYRVGSISKIYTAVLIMQAAEEGKLSLDAKLGGFYPFIPNAHSISIRQLLSHRSGIFNFTDDPAYMGYMTQKKSRNDLLEIISKYEPEFEPGAQHAYSNSNYLLLSLILEQVYKKDFSDLLQEKITKPLNLKHTYLGQSKQEKGEVPSFGYAGQWMPAPVTDMSIPLGAGAVVSTAKDVTQFLTALFNHELVSKQSLHEMKKLKQGYGLGLMSFPFYDKQGLGHNGGIDGFISNTAFIEEDGLAICVLSNGLNYNFNDVLIAVLSSHYDKPFDLPSFDAIQIELAKDELSSFAGEFESAQLPLDIKFFLNEGTLLAQATGQGAFPLKAYENGEFRFDQAGIIIKFANDKSGFTLNQGGGKFQFSRK